MYINESIKKYVDDLAAREPTPGGGSAASLAGALGAALLEMVCNFTIGNKKYKDIEESISGYLIVIKKIREEFLILVDEDTKIYSSICAAFKTKDEKIIDKALKDGYYISLKICELAKSGMKISLGLAEKSNVNLITDVGCGSEFLKASFYSGVFNAEINLKGIKEKSFIETESLVLRILEKEISDLYKKTISKTNERSCDYAR
ncbi:MAG: cyclodeaminase/cyclohydrolase family protein [Candidatus Omnitrophica bacterium]|nr:cyclodeaminase/cyclohydrolase family protein [Candidatus Omnitrophota bacterium]